MLAIMLALLGRSIPSNIGVFTLALAIIDDVIAVLIIAFFYSGGLDLNGFGRRHRRWCWHCSGRRRLGLCLCRSRGGDLDRLLMTGAHPASPASCSA